MPDDSADLPSTPGSSAPGSSAPGPSAPSPAGDRVRLNKWIASRGIASRREADRLIADGRVRVNGSVVTELGVKIVSGVDRVEVTTQGLPEHLYVALHKPAGYLTAPFPVPGEPRVVTQLVNLSGLFPVGRLDKDSTGLLLLTNDGTLTTALNHPERQKEKEYEVTVDRPIPEGALRRLSDGVPLFDGEKTLPAQVVRTGPDSFRITITEGKNRQIRRMCRKVGHEVVALKRVRIDAVRLGNLSPGQWRHLTADEVAALKSPANGDNRDV
ncbi:MAG: rRNA pseudouridine synthase [Nitrospirota bacterium]|nr:rRNA pseudouridine synthase [Nitrospirota bacterium]